MPRWPSSLRARLTLWYAIFLGLPLIVLAVACYLVFARTLLARTDEFIGDALTAFSRELSAERRAALTMPEAMQTTVAEVRFRDLHIAILDATGQIVAITNITDNDAAEGGPSSAAIGDRVATALREHGLARPLALTLVTSDGAYRMLSRPLVVAAEHFSLTGTYSLGDIDETLERIRAMFLVAVPVLVACAATGGYFLAKRSLAPVSSMAAHAARISVTNFDDRFPVEGGDELAGLARVVNDLLDRLEHSFAQQRQFVADASHELRTPAAILRTEADVTLSRDHRDEAEYRASMTIVQDAARRLGRVVDDLFLLARADSGNLVAQREPLYLEELVHDAARGVRSVASARGIQVDVRRLVEAPLRGDADLIGRLLLNLLDNAIKHSPAGGTVTVELASTGEEYEITVSDTGPGIPDDARERVFERFYRVDAARSRADNSATSGAGLGLAIGRRIAEMHSGRLELTASRPGHTEFRLTLPFS